MERKADRYVVYAYKNTVIFSASLLISMQMRHLKADPSALFFSLSMKCCDFLFCKEVICTICSS